MTQLLADRTAIVTGGASGIGRGIALALAEHGADVVVADIRTEPRTDDTTPTLEAIEDSTDARAVFAHCDVTEPDGFDAALEAADELGGLDVMVNNAGVSSDADFLTATHDDFDAIVDVNLRGVYFGCQAAGTYMLQHGGGSIINIASTAAERGYERSGAALYAGTKGGVRSMTFTVAEILGPEVRVNAILPGFTLESGFASSGHDPAYIEQRAAETALHRLGYPEDIGGAAVFLASDLSSYVTAETLLLDGGWVHTGGP